MRNSAMAATALVLAAWAAGPALAQNRPPVIGDQYDPYYGRQGDRICARMCPEDRSPCDPIHWKRADARCSDRRRWKD
jgi:hypothetical protein